LLRPDFTPLRLNPESDPEEPPNLVESVGLSTEGTCEEPPACHPAFQSPLGSAGDAFRQPRFREDRKSSARSRRTQPPAHDRLGLINAASRAAAVTCRTVAAPDPDYPPCKELHRPLSLGAGTASIS